MGLGVLEREKAKQTWLRGFLRGERGFKQRRKSGARKWGLFHSMAEGNTTEGQ